MSCPVAHVGSASVPAGSLAEKTSKPSVEKLENIPQPPTRFITGNLSELDPSFLSRSFWRLADIYGPIFKLQLPGREVLIVSSYDLINEVCDQDRFGKMVPGVQVEIRSFLGNGLFTSDTDDPDWWKAHRLLVPAFGPLAIRKMFPQMMDIASQMILKWDRLGPDHEIVTADDFTRLAFDTIGITGFNYRFNSFYSDQPVAFATQMAEALTEGGKRASRIPIENHLRIWSNAKYHENINAMNELCDKLIADRKANPKPEVNDILNVMLNQRDPETHEKLSDENIRYQLVTFLVAGHETTSGTLAFLMYNLLNNPDTYHKAQQEVDEVLGDDPLEPKHLPKFKYIEACIRETLRFMGPIGVFSVHCREPTVIGGKYKVTPEQSITCNLRGLHHDPKAWGDDADVFRPERLLDGGWEALPPNAWKPFGNGLRACIGRALAEQEMLINVPLILQRFNVTKADPSYKLELKSTLTIKPDGFSIKVRRRPGKSLMVGLQGIPSAKEAADAHTEKERSKPIKTSLDGKKPLTIAWGSNSGTCKSFAEDLQSNAPDFGFEASLSTLDAMVEHVPTDQPIVFITPSYEGQPPDNGKQFVSWLEANKEKKILDGVEYCVFGAGNSEWTHTFHRIPKLINELVAKEGGERILEMSAVDVNNDALGPFEDWKETFWQRLREQSGAKGEVEVKPLSVKVEKSEVPKTLAGGEVSQCAVLKNELLVGTDVGPAKRHMQVLLPPGMSYSSGDYLVVLPFNTIQVVRRVLSRYKLRVDDTLFVGDTKKEYLVGKHPESAFDFFASRVEMNTPATKRQVATLASAMPESERKSIERLLGDDVYEKEVLGRRASVIDLLEDFPTCQLELGAFIDMLKPLTPRQYSISSSPLASAGATEAGSANQPITASITYDVLEAPATSGHDRVYHGTASSYLALCEPGTQIRCWVSATNANFHLPPDPETPIIMVCAGTGLAPMRGFIETRAALADAGVRKLGPALLYFGCRDYKKDYIYKDQLEAWHKAGVVDVRPAFSRRGPPDAGAGYKYAPDRLWADREEAAQLFRDGAKIFVCGSASKLARSTGDVCMRIYRERFPEKSEQDAIDWLQKVKEDRYVTDVFG